MIQDLRFGLRMLVRNRLFTLIALITMALGIGVNTSIFSIVHAMLLRPLPYPQPRQLFWIEEDIPVLSQGATPGSHYLDWAERSRSFETIAAYSDGKQTMSGVGEPERVDGCRVSANFFPTLGAGLMIGRNFLQEEDRAGGERTAILSHSFWQKRFKGESNILGQSIKLDDESFRIIGVLSPEFRFFVKGDVWQPLALDYVKEHGRLIRFVKTFGRLKPGVTVSQATAELETIRRGFEGEAQKTSPLFQGVLQLTPLDRQLVGDARRLLLILFGAVTLILLIACANVANLMLARGAARQKEMAVRAALGGGRWRLLRQLLTESLLLAAAGGVCGLFLAWGLTALLANFSPPGAFGKVALVSAIRIDAGVLGFTLLVSLLSGVFFGLAPALQISRPDLNTSLKEGIQGGVQNRGRFRQTLLIAEISLAVVLLIGAGLLIRSFVNVINVDTGFRADRLLTAHISLPYPRYEDEVRRKQFFARTLERISAVPGIESVGLTSALPMTDYNSRVWLQVEGGRGDREQGKPPTPMGVINPDYFQTMGISLRAGRLFDARDRAETPPVIILSQSLAAKLYPGENPIGKRINTARENNPEWTEIVGVVSDIRQQGLDQEISPMVYQLYRQRAPDQILIAVRSALAISQLAAILRAAVQAVDPDQPLDEVMTMDERLSQRSASRRFTLILVGMFAMLALTLAAVGVYGVISYVVSQRTQEIGVRMALGAQTSDILKLFLKQGLLLALGGVGIGLLAALAATRVMNSLLFDVRATDPLTFAGVALLLALIALVACWAPARRATKVSPIMALRQ
jgi:predicted permease